MSSFGSSIYTRKVNIVVAAEEDQSNLLNNIVELNHKSTPDQKKVTIKTKPGSTSKNLLNEIRQIIFFVSSKRNY